MAELKLVTLVQSVLARKVAVARSERIGTRLADRATPTFLPFAWSPSNEHDADPNPPHVKRGQPAPTQRGGLRAGRSVRLSWGLRSRHLRPSASRRDLRRMAMAPRVAAMYRLAGRCPAAVHSGLKPTAVQ